MLFSERCISSMSRDTGSFLMESGPLIFHQIQAGGFFLHGLPGLVKFWGVNCISQLNGFYKIITNDSLTHRDLTLPLVKKVLKEFDNLFLVYSPQNMINFATFQTKGLIYSSQLLSCGEHAIF